MRLSGALGADHARARPAASRGRRARPCGGSRARRGRGPRRPSAEQRLARRRRDCHDASARSAAASACSRISVSRPRLDRDGDPLGLLRLALDRVDDPVAQPADPGLERLEQLAGADELLPARQHLAAQQGAVGGRLGDLRTTAVVGRVGVVAQPLGGRRPARRRASATAWVRRVRVRIAPSRVCCTTACRASASAASSSSQRADLGDRGRRQQAVVVDRRPRRR